jgi:hypothetical protein
MTASEFLGPQQGVDQINGEQERDAPAEDEVEDHEMALLKPFAEQRIGDEAGEEAGTEGNENEIGHGRAPREPMV